MDNDFEEIAQNTTNTWRSVLSSEIDDWEFSASKRQQKYKERTESCQFELIDKLNADSCRIQAVMLNIRQSDVVLGLTKQRF